MNGTFQPSAHRATIASVRFSPPPPTQIGSSACTGRGSQRASFSWKYFPSKFDTSSRSSRRTHCTDSSRMSRRSLVDGNGMP